MARIIKEKNLNNTALASNYGGWIYCSGCNQTIGYLCYATYDSFSLGYVCKCGNAGSIHVALEDGVDAMPSDAAMPMVKNRLCCPEDASPLATIRDVNLTSYQCTISCHTCHKQFQKGLPV